MASPRSTRDGPPADRDAGRKDGRYGVGDRGGRYKREDRGPRDVRDSRDGRYDRDHKGHRNGSKDRARHNSGRDDYGSRRHDTRSRSPARNDRGGRENTRQRSPPRGPRPNRPSSPRGARPSQSQPSSQAPGGSKSSVKGDIRDSSQAKGASGPNEDTMDLDGDPEDSAMKAVMGFTDFRSTKNTKVPGNDRNYAVRKEKRMEARQYMNRVGGFNRPLSPSQM